MFFNALSARGVKIAMSTAQNTTAVTTVNTTTKGNNK